MSHDIMMDSQPYYCLPITPSSSSSYHDALMEEEEDDNEQQQQQQQHDGQYSHQNSTITTTPLSTPQQQQRQQQQEQRSPPSSSFGTTTTPSTSTTITTTFQSPPPSNISRRKGSPGSTPGTMSPTNNTVVCHICGRKYTMNSIHIHYQHCEYLWDCKQKKLPIEQRRPVPSMVSVLDQIQTMTIEEHNTLALQVFNQHNHPPKQQQQQQQQQESHGENNDDQQIDVEKTTSVKQQQQQQLQTDVPSPNTNNDNNNDDDKDDDVSLNDDLPQQQKSTANSFTHPATATDNANMPSNNNLVCKPAHAPNTVICHICGRKYTIHSIDIHLPQCVKLWKKRQQLLPKNQRKPVPTLQDQMMKLPLEQRNEAAMDIYNNVALEKCPHCDRTFLPDRLKVHLPSCSRTYNNIKHQEQIRLRQQQRKKERDHHKRSKRKYKYQQRKHKGGREEIIISPQKTPTLLDRLKLKECKICGRTFFSDRLQVHLRSCSRPSTTGSMHDKPYSSFFDDNFSVSQQSTISFRLQQELEQKEKQRLQTALQQNKHRISSPTLLPCEHCGRTFYPDRLQVHTRSCTRNPYFDNSDTYSISQTTTTSLFRQQQEELEQKEQQKLQIAMQQNKHRISNPSLVPCEHCGRTFFPDRLQVHVRSCSRNPYFDEHPNNNSNNSPSKSITSSSSQPQQQELEEQEQQKLQLAIEQNKRRISDPALEPCEHCRRTFYPDRLQVHIRSCSRNKNNNNNKISPRQLNQLENSSSFGSSTKEGTGDESKSSNKKTRVPNPSEKLQPCIHCGRTFFSDRLEVHLRSCQQQQQQEKQLQKRDDDNNEDSNRKKGKDDKDDDDINDDDDDDDDDDAVSCSSSAAQRKVKKNSNKKKKKKKEKRISNISSMLKPCEHCGRTFYEDRLQIHVRSCARKKAQQSLLQQQQQHHTTTTTTDSNNVDDDDELSSMSLSVHDGGEQQTTKKKKKKSRSSRTCSSSRKQNKNPQEEQEHGRHDDDDDDDDDDMSSISSFSQAERKKKIRITTKNPASTLEPCIHCGRTFYPDRLQVHIRSCSRNKLLNNNSNKNKKKNTTIINDNHNDNDSIRSSRSSRSHSSNYYDDIISSPKTSTNNKRVSTKKKVRISNTSLLLEPCIHCGRTFFPDRLQVHLRSCSKSKQQQQHRRRSSSSNNNNNNDDNDDDDDDNMTACSKSSACSRTSVCSKVSMTSTNSKKNRIPNPSSVMEACKYCGRTFYSDRLQVHLKGCSRRRNSNEKNHNNKDKNHHPTTDDIVVGSTITTKIKSKSKSKSKHHDKNRKKKSNSHTTSSNSTSTTTTNSTSTSARKDTASTRDSETKKNTIAAITETTTKDEKEESNAENKTNYYTNGNSSTNVPVATNSTTITVTTNSPASSSSSSPVVGTKENSLQVDTTSFVSKDFQKYFSY